MADVTYPLSVKLGDVGRSNRLIDINGDGLEDLIGVGSVRLNMQGDFAKPILIPGISNIEMSVPIDLDGDGRISHGRATP